MSDAPSSAEAPSPPRHIPTFLYIAGVWSLGVGLTVAALVVDGLRVDWTFAMVCLLAILTWWSGATTVETAVDGRVLLSFSNIVMLAAIALVGPAGAGIVGLLMGPLQRGEVPMRARVFNTGMSGTLGVLGSVAFLSTGGMRDSSDLVGAGSIIRHVGVPVLVAGLVHIAVNLVLLAGVVRLASGLPMRSQITRLLSSIGPAYLGYGIIAFLMVVLWQPAGLGPWSVLLVVAPLLVARWAFNQYAEEVKGHELALQVLVAAVEAKAPHLTGHSSRVAALSAQMAEHLGLRSHVVADIRLAGMLHDLGQTTMPTPVVRGSDAHSPALAEYPARGAAILGHLAFLRGSLDAVLRHRDVLGARAQRRYQPRDLPALVVGVADEFDLLTEVGTPDGLRLDEADAVQVVGRMPGVPAELVRALQHSLSRRRTAVTG